MDKIAFHTEEELKQYKISNYDSYEYTKYLECPECGTRYRFHGVTTERNDYYKFLENFSLKLYMQEKK